MNIQAINVLSPTNVCHTFDKAADDYGRAEGVGASYIKRLDLALKNSDPIHAVISIYCHQFVSGISLNFN